MKVIWKYPLNLVADKAEPIFVPSDYEILSAGLDPKNQLCVWIAVDSDSIARTPLYFTIVGTGHFEPEGFTYLDTVKTGPFMWHIYVREQ